MKTKYGEITVESIQEAVRKTGLTIVQEEWGDGVTCACALSAFLIANNPKVLETFDISDADGDQIAERLDADRKEVRMFVAGFDAYELEGNAESDPAYLLGISVRNALGFEPEGEDDDNDNN